MQGKEEEMTGGRQGLIRKESGLHVLFMYVCHILCEEQ